MGQQPRACLSHFWPGALSPGYWGSDQHVVEAPVPCVCVWWGEPWGSGYWAKPEAIGVGAENPWAWGMGRGRWRFCRPPGEGRVPAVTCC